MNILVYILLGAASFLFVIVPISGSFIINPLLALVIDPHAAISIAAFFFLINSSIKAFIFRKDIQYSYVKIMLPLSLVAAAVGALVVGFIPEKLLLIIIFAAALYFLLKTLSEYFTQNIKDKKSHSMITQIVSLVSGFMQGTGVGSGGSLRKIYLLSENLSLSQMHGTTSFIGIWLLVASVGVRLGTDQVTFEMLLPVIYLIPLMILAVWLGRRFLKRLNRKHARIVTIVVMVAVTAMLGVKIF